MKKTFVSSLAVGLFVAFGFSSAAVAQQWDPSVIKQAMEWKDMAAAKKELPSNIPGVKIITTEELKKWMDTKKNFILLDNRVKEQYDAEKIKGAKWLLADNMLADPKLLDQFKKDDVLVQYCNGVLCWRSPAAALMFVKAGFKEVYWYREGLPAWKAQKLPTE